MHPASVIVVDDDVFFRSFCSDVLRQEGLRVRTASTGTEALARLEEEPPDLVLADIYMPEMTGLELLQAVKARRPSVDVLIMTGYASIDTAVRALKHGAADYLRKPFAAEELAAVVRATLEQRQLVREHSRLKRQLELYELARSFLGSDEPDRVVALGLEAVARATRSEQGVVLRHGPGAGPLGVAARFGLGQDQAEALRDALVLRAERYLRGLEAPRVLGRARLLRVLAGCPGVPEARELLLLPLRLRGGLDGVVVLARGPGGERFSQEDTENAFFLSQQMELALDAAERFREARQLAFVDPLTDLYNARYLERVLDDAIRESERSGLPFSLLFLDLDRFKEINDAHGHLTGGKVLIEVSRLLQANVRENDTLIRYGGDEFVALLPGADTAAAVEVAERIRQAIRSHRFLGREGRSIHLTASVGVATYPRDASSREELVDKADRAMYRNKEASRDAVYQARLL